MKRPNHTPGPWQRLNVLDVFTGLGATNADGVQATINDGWQIADCEVSTTCTVGGIVSLSTAEQKCNAQLIAAAPSLVEALHSLMEVAKLYSAFGFLAEIESEVEEARKALELAGWTND
jgi:hypothetical protein